MDQKLNSKIKNNAKLAYLLMFCSWLLLFNKVNSNINNSFVRSHVKSSSIIHLFFIIIYIIFISNGLGSSISIFGLGLNDLITNIVFLFLLSVLLFGMYKSGKGEYFYLGESIKSIKAGKLIDIKTESSGKLNENDKLTILLSLIPFIGFLNYGKYSKNPIIKSNTNLSIIVSLISILLLIYGYNGLSSLLVLIYTISIVYIGINLFTKENLIKISISNYFSIEVLYLNLLSLISYLKNYVLSRPFQSFLVINKELTDEYIKNEYIDEQSLMDKKDIKFNKLIYIPFLSLIFLFIRGSKYRFHIANANTITFLIVVLLIVSNYVYLSPYLYLLFIFPILLGTGFLKYRLAYKIPIIFDLYLFFFKVLSLFRSGSKAVNELRKKENNVSFKSK